jgi:hypothetical protein
MIRISFPSNEKDEEMNQQTERHGFRAIGVKDITVLKLFSVCSVVRKETV